MRKVRVTHDPHGHTVDVLQHLRAHDIRRRAERDKANATQRDELVAETHGDVDVVKYDKDRSIPCNKRKAMSLNSKPIPPRSPAFH
jgi:hypothetical protein